MKSKVLMKKLKQFSVLIFGGTFAFTAINTIKADEKFYSNIVMPLVHRLIPDGENSHRLGVLGLKYRLWWPKNRISHDSRTNKVVFGLNFPSPIGVAAGFDKHGEAIEGLFDVGFGFVEIGSITPEPQDGNAKPRVFRLIEDEGVVNRYGFNSEGHDVVVERLKQFRENEKSGERKIVGVNLGKNKSSSDATLDYVKGIQKFGNLPDYYVVNVSSPNTQGLRDLQHEDNLKSLLSKVLKERNKLSERVPVLLKIAPDLSMEEKSSIAKIVLSNETRVDGLIVSNTTTSRPQNLKSVNFSEEGGLSGSPLRDISTQAIKDFHRLTSESIPIIGVGGVSCGKDALDKLHAGASLVQLYTALIYHGPPVVKRITRELMELEKMESID